MGRKLWNIIIPNVKEPIDYFRAMFPMPYTKKIVVATNMQFQQISSNYRLTEAIFFKYLGIILAMALSPQHGGMEEY